MSFSQLLPGCRVVLFCEGCQMFQEYIARWLLCRSEYSDLSSPLTGHSLVRNWIIFARSQISWAALGIFVEEHGQIHRATLVTGRRSRISVLIALLQNQLRDQLHKLSSRGELTQRAQEASYSSAQARKTHLEGLLPLWRSRTPMRSAIRQYQEASERSRETPALRNKTRHPVLRNTSLH